MSRDNAVVALEGAPVVALEDAVVARDGRPVLHGVSMRIGVGEVTAILGPNGSGKSTLVRGLLGIDPLVSGSVRLFDTPLAAFRGWSRIGYVPQRSGAGSGVPATVGEVVSSGLLARRGLARWPRPGDRAAVVRALATVGLAQRRGDRVTTLSGGQQQRVLLARALVGDPDLLILDEPNAGVDAASQDAFADTVAQMAEHGKTVLLVLHEAGPLEPLIGRAVVLEAGRVVHDGEPPPPAGHHARAGHDHVHPHADDRTSSFWAAS